MSVLPKPLFYDTLVPLYTYDHTGIRYTTCRDYNHISRNKGLRQIVHGPFGVDRYIALETGNPIQTNGVFFVYEVPLEFVNRLDLIANKFFGTAQYSWIIAYFNDIEDGFTVHHGQKLKILRRFSTLFQKGEILAPIPPLQLNLGEE